MQVHAETLRLARQETYPAKKPGQPPIVIDRWEIEITINGSRRTVACFPSADRICIFGIAVRFQYGDKVWPGSAIYWKESGNINNITPNIDKRGSFSIVGFASDYEGKASRSQHNAVS